MRIALALLLAALAAQGGPAPPAPEVERIDIRLSGDVGTNIGVNRRGEGSYDIGGTDPRGGGGAFSITPEQFDRLRDCLAPFRAQAEPRTDESLRRIIEHRCPRGVPYVTDAGAIYIRWRGPGTDHHYSASFSCDPGRNAARNSELREIVSTLPVPLPR